MDAVGPVHVRDPGCLEQRRVRGVKPDEGVAGRLGVVVGLGLDDDAAARAVRDRAADELPRGLDDRQLERAQVAVVGRVHAGASAARARTSWSRTRASEFAALTFESSHELC